MRGKLFAWRLMVLLVLLAVFLCGCGKSEKVVKAENMWDCSVYVVFEDATAIMYSEVEMQTNSGQLYFQNRNAFSVHLYLYANGELETEAELSPGGALAFLHVLNDKVYTVGFHADQPQGTEIVVMAYDGMIGQEDSN
ncbi:MAG: hypothetical protein UEP57_01290 [Oscillospiraceae bacterium]|nr:hypothetical protein [Oscillospiraceae bacterium]